MVHSLAVSWWLTLALAALAGTLLVRVFIIFHDCGHGSFFRSRLANDVTGFIAGMLTFTPYYHWRWEHSLHHATAGDLDRRGTGDVWTMTVQEYLESSRWKRFAYRLARNPVVLFVLAPLFLFVVRQRFPSAKASSRERKSVMWMNLALLAMATALSWVFGLVPYVLIQSTVMMVGGSAGVWLFYVQHQFEDAYWERREDWDYTAAALEGSSFYKLPKTLQWLSGNIGFHHIHHLSSRVPNYNLERCGSQTRHALLQLRRQPLPALGRATAQARGLPAPQGSAPAGERRRKEAVHRLRRAGRGSQPRTGLDPRSRGLSSEAHGLAPRRPCQHRQTDRRRNDRC
jgi:omega-6 fatty acid desaturase (delta-12 desaturase)